MTWSRAAVAVLAVSGAGLVVAATLGIGLAAPAGAALLAAGVWLASGARQAARLTEATLALERVTAGHFDVRVEVGGPPEARALARAVNRVGQSCARRDDDLGDALDDAARQRDLFYAIINASSDGLLLYDAERRLVAANPRCGELLGFSVDELLHRDPRWLQHVLQTRCEAPERYQEQLEAHFARPGEVHRDVLVLRTPRRRVIRRISSPATIERRTGGRVFTYTDVTVEADIDRMKSEFVSMASHELRTPLTSVHGALQLALTASGHLIDEEDRELLEISLTNTERLVRLVTDLLDLSKFDAGRMPLLRAPLDLVTLVDEAARGMQGFTACRRARLVMDAPPGPQQVFVDRDQILRVLTNLLSNAFKYSPPDSVVTVAVHDRPDGIAVSITDQGPGIPPEHFDRLFQPFSRVGVHAQEAGGGTGLGLAISRAIVEQHGGRIWVEAHEPTGSRFVVVLPRPPAAGVDATPPAEAVA